MVNEGFVFPSSLPPSLSLVLLLFLFSFFLVFQVPWALGTWTEESRDYMRACAHHTAVRGRTFQAEGTVCAQDGVGPLGL